MSCKNNRNSKDRIEDKENGTNLVLSKFEDDVTFEYHITIQDEGFNLGILTMRTPEGVFQTDFDEFKGNEEEVEGVMAIHGLDILSPYRGNPI